MKVEHIEFRELFLAFFSMAIFSIANVYVINIVFFAFFVASIISTHGKITITDNRLLKYMCSYLAWILVDVIIVTVNRNYPIGLRNIIQVVFEVQYIIWAMQIDIKIEKYTDYLIKIAMIYSLILIIAFVVTGTFRHMDQIFGVYREWGEKIFPGNTTSAPIPFIFALFLCLYYNKGYGRAVLITIGGLLFPSRVSLLALLIVWFFFAYEKITRNSKAIIWILCGTFIIVLPEILVSISNYFPDLIYRLTVTWDRVDILRTVYHYVHQHFFVGYGGRTLNQLYSLEPYVTSTGAAWPHAHNFIFEEMVRYGVIGTILFLLVLICSFKRIKDRKIRFIYVLFIIMSLFQTYMREFNYIFYIYIMLSIKIKGDDINANI